MDDFSSLKTFICDDSITNVMILSKLLEEEGIKHVQTFTDPRKLMAALETEGAIDLLILDIEMPHMNGFEVMQAIQAKLPPPERYPILIITGSQGTEVRNKALSEGASDYLNKPFDQTEVVLRVKNLLRYRQAYKFQLNAAKELERLVEQRTHELDNATEYLIHRMALAGELRDNETGQHVARVGRYSRILAEGVGLPSELCYLIEKAAPLHDIGKIGIPDAILHKNGKLDAEEYEVMRSHTVYGEELLGDHDSMIIQLAASIARNHHEKWDGSGYPAGLKGESIPIEGRITAISDVFDALTTRRPYKEPWPLEKVVGYFQELSGAAFDPALVRVFMANVEKFSATMRELADAPR